MSAFLRARLLHTAWKAIAELLIKGKRLCRPATDTLWVRVVPGLWWPRHLRVREEMCMCVYDVWRSTKRVRERAHAPAQRSLRRSGVLLAGLVTHLRDVGLAGV